MEVIEPGRCVPHTGAFPSFGVVNLGKEELAPLMLSSLGFILCS